MVNAPHRETVTTTTQKLITYDPLRTSVTIYNASAGTIYMGVDNSLTTVNGFPIGAGDTVSMSYNDGDDPRIARTFVVAAGTLDILIDEEHEGYMPEHVRKKLIEEGEIVE